MTMPHDAPGERVRCIAHVHSTHSDGSATVAELREEARAAGARVLLLTDHDSMAARDRGEDGWGGDVLVVTGHEVSPRGGHLLVFGTDEVVAHRGLDEREILDAVAEAGGVGYAAHPFSAGSAMLPRVGRPHPWSEFRHPALRGLELWSHTTDVSEAWRTPAAALRDLRDPLASTLAGPPERHLRAWDELTAQGVVLAVLGGQDAHARGVRVRGRVRSVMPHRRWMGLVQTVLELDRPLRGDDEADRAAVLDALHEGRTSLVVPPLGDPLEARIAVADGELAVDAPDDVVVRVVGEDTVRVELLRRAPRGGLARWILSSPYRRAAEPGSPSPWHRTTSASS
jgi:hypothetical protein